MFDKAHYNCRPLTNLPDDTANKRFVSCYVDPTSNGYIKVFGNKIII